MRRMCDAKETNTEHAPSVANVFPSDSAKNGHEKKCISDNNSGTILIE